MTDSRLPRAKKSLGQNFLSDKNFVNEIVNAAHISPDDVVIEIGPGRGALTEQLVEKAQKVIAVELDRELAPMLRERFADRPNFSVIEADALTIDFAEFGSDLILIANLPYYISTAILMRLITYRRRFSRMVLMFQREVVDRMTAEPGDSERGYLTVITEAFLEVERLFDVPPTAFKPVPKIWSSVVRLTPRDTRFFDGRETEFETLVSAAFLQKRKTLQNNLRRAAAELGIKNISELLEAAKIEPSRRAETLSIDEWVRLLAALNG